MSTPYENARLERIKENRERMQRLGLFDLSSKLTSLASSASTRKRKRKNPVLASSNSTPQPQLEPLPARRSSRLQNATPIIYSEEVHVKRERKERTFKDNKVRLKVGSRPEVYTEEHEKLLGNTERSWTLFVDGCGTDGRRIYDPFKGKTCHQCRQKTLGYRTHCSNCQMVQGQFCGDCLYMRYGEHVLEALENENWICPPCRGICNCSLCRQAKGWPPTGQMYKKISFLGFKSVAHYLIQTRRSQDDATIHQSSAKRSLPFSAAETSFPQPLMIKGEEQMSGSGEVDHDQMNRSLQFPSEKWDVIDLDQEADEELGTDKHVSQGITQTSEDGCLREPSPIASKQTSPEILEISLVNHELNEEVNDAEGSAQILGVKLTSNVEPSPDSIASRLRQRRKTNDGIKEAKNQTAMQVEQHTDDEVNHGGRNAPMLGVKPTSNVEPSPDSIASRLRQRRRTNDGIKEEAKNQTAMQVEQHTDDEVNDGGGSALILWTSPTSVLKSCPDSIASRLRDRLRTNDGINEEAKNQTTMQVKNENHGAIINTALKKTPILKRRPTNATEPDLDSIGSRLRQRRQMVKCVGA